MKYRASLVAIVLISCLTLNLKAQSFLGGTQDVNAFADYNEKRNKLNIEIPNLEKQVGEIYLKDSLYIARDIAANKGNIIYFNNLLTSKVPNKMSIDSIQNAINFYTTRADELVQEMENNKFLSRKRDDLKLQIETKKGELSKVENSINLLMIPKISQQNFMYSSSIAFVVLMSLLLGTFFFVVWRDEVIRRSIFGSDSGIQFIALFSIIIAIIIFGLTGVLEGKELSALLGSVAGYILGKAKFNSNSTPPEPAVVPPVVPPVVPLVMPPVEPPVVPPVIPPVEPPVVPADNLPEN